MPASTALIIVLVAHELLRQPYAHLHALTVPLLVLPAAYYASVLGIRGAILIGALCALSIAFHINDWHLTAVVAEVVAVLAVSAIAAVIGAMSGRESKTLAAIGEASRQRLDELDDPGYWDRVSVTQIGLYSARIESEFISRALSRHANGVTADIGAGSGRLHRVMRPHSKLIAATDISKNALQTMKPDPTGAAILVGPDQETLPFRSGVLRAVVAMEAPAASDTTWFRAECHRTLEPGGVVVVSIHNALSYKGLYTRLLRSIRARRGRSWASLYYRASFSAHVHAWQTAGFNVKASVGFYWLPFSRASNSTWVHPMAAIERVLGLRRLVGWSPWVLLELERCADDRAARNRINVR